ncbi:hypothetical protein ACFVFS_04410 [Kitasatospora sp. NPDC057692]|uniref:HD domain-containing protein n=1 Tax=Kitasatospora sp. NPDC057692 TaxID=3346215 RepID=UPI0036C3C617
MGTDTGADAAGSTWNSVAGDARVGLLVQGGHVTVHSYGDRRDSGTAPTPPADPWVRAVLASRVWDHVPDDRAPHRSRPEIAEAARRLAALRDEAAAVLADDPWYDPGFAERFLERVEWLLGDEPLDLHPAEAGLFLLLPLIDQVHRLRLSARLAAVGPDRIAPRRGEGGRGADGPERADYERHLAERDLLAGRARRRPEAERPIGWWLFHRWTAGRSELVEPALVAHLAESGEGLADALRHERVARLVHGLRRGPGVCNREYLDTLAVDDALRGPGRQRVREQRLALLLALAHGLAIDPTGLPDIIVDHVGIPDQVDPAELRATVAGAVWGDLRHLPVLRADCRHEAVVEALREYTDRVDDLLHAVRRTIARSITVPMPGLPERLSADDLRPADTAVVGSARFRLGERRVRELLMGDQLYKDRDLAVRELYQNALDACRYRRARTEYLERTGVPVHPFEGAIVLDQGVDEDGRAYLECRDNGIGMGEAEPGGRLLARRGALRRTARVPAGAHRVGAARPAGEAVPQQPFRDRRVQLLHAGRRDPRHQLPDGPRRPPGPRRRGGDLRPRSPLPDRGDGAAGDGAGNDRPAVPAGGPGGGARVVGRGRAATPARHRGVRDDGRARGAERGVGAGGAAAEGAGGHRPSCRRMAPGLAGRARGRRTTVTEDLPTAPEEGTGLYQLIRIARRTGFPLAQVADWLRAMGANVPDPATAIRAALARVPRDG